MKILRLTTQLDYGGQEKKIELLAKNYSGPHELIFVALGRGGYTAQLLEELGYEVHLMGIESPNVYNFRVFLPLYRLLRDLAPDIIHTAASEANFHGGLVAKFLKNTKVITEEIGIPNHGKIGRILFRYIYKTSSDFVWISKAVGAQVERLGEVKKGQGRVIYNPIEFVDVLHQNQGQKKDKFHVVSVGRLEPVKNFELIFKALNKVVKHEIRYTVIGKGSQMEYLKTLAEKANDNISVEFLGFRSNPTEHIQNADLFILPSLTEGFGIAIAEAMYARVLTAGTSIGGIPEFVTHGENGFLFDPTRESELATIIENIIEMPIEEREDMIESAYTLCADRFSVNKYLEQLFELYEEHQA